jgi:hypothetical protein
MTQRGDNFNAQNLINRTVAPLTNVSLCSKAMLRATDRPGHLPGFVCFYGPSGWGKSTAASYVHLTQNTYYIQCMESWTRKAVLLALLKQMGIEPKKNHYEMLEQICQQLADSMRPLIIDEFDHLVKRDAVEMIRDIYEGSRAAILLIGEEQLPQKLGRWERFHGRVLDWIPAQPADFDDCRHLARLYCDRVTIREDLLQDIHAFCNGSARRIVNNLDHVQVVIGQEGMDEAGREEWKGRPFLTGEAPKRSVRS